MGLEIQNHSQISLILQRHALRRGDPDVELSFAQYVSSESVPSSLTRPYRAHSASAVSLQATSMTRRAVQRYKLSSFDTYSPIMQSLKAYGSRAISLKTFRRFCSSVPFAEPIPADVGQNTGEWTY
nr:hypothetical protein CFP56_57957 [Quercus suber]